MSKDPSACRRILIGHDAVAVAARYAFASFAIAPCDPYDVSMENNVTTIFNRL